jgi:hypothetical protein
VQTSAASWAHRSACRPPPEAAAAEASGQAEARRRWRSSRAVSQKHWAVAASRRSGSARIKSR